MIVQHVNEAENVTQRMKKPNLPVYFDLYFSYPIMYLLCGRGVIWNAINNFIIIIIIITKCGLDVRGSQKSYISSQLKKFS
jgi:hypothetical protein